MNVFLQMAIEAAKEAVPVTPKRKRGRPRGSRNKPVRDKFKVIKHDEWWGQ